MVQFWDKLLSPPLTASYSPTCPRIISSGRPSINNFSRPASPIARAISRSAITRRIASASPRASPTSDSIPVRPSSTHSGIPPALVANTGRPHPIASMMLIGWFSTREHWISTCVRRKNAPLSIRPANSTRPASHPRRACRSSRSRKGPSPATRIRHACGESPNIRASRSPAANAVLDMIQLFCGDHITCIPCLFFVSHIYTAPRLYLRFSNLGSTDKGRYAPCGVFAAVATNRLLGLYSTGMNRVEAFVQRTDGSFSAH